MRQREFLDKPDFQSTSGQFRCACRLIRARGGRGHVARSPSTVGPASSVKKTNALSVTPGSKRLATGSDSENTGFCDAREHLAVETGLSRHLPERATSSICGPGSSEAVRGNKSCHRHSASVFSTCPCFLLGGLFGLVF